MKRILITVASVSLLTGCAHRQSNRGDFFLIDPSGGKTGPYHIVHAGKLSVGGVDYTVFIPSVAEDQHAVVRKMKRIIIPEIAFHQVNINDVLAFLLDASVEFDTGPKPKGISVLGPCASPPQETTASVDPFAEPNKEPEPIALITFNARNISLYDAMSVVCAVAGITWEPRGSAVIFLPKKAEAVQQHDGQISFEGAPSAPPNESSP
ncbi:MAG: hypothetical protein FJ224_12960 [Lentisphaerae bacterium]|nr:hypothetical protein [Lentisphaerota bacterium]